MAQPQPHARKLAGVSWSKKVYQLLVGWGNGGLRDGSGLSYDFIEGDSCALFGSLMACDRFTVSKDVKTLDLPILLARVQKYPA